MARFPFFRQHDAVDCGPACLKMIASYYGRKYSLEYLRRRCFTNKEGVNLLTLSDAAESIGLRTLKTELKPAHLYNDVPLPAIVHWNNNHFIVVYKLKRNRTTGNVSHLYIADPAIGRVCVDEAVFTRHWISSPDKMRGYALLLEPAEEFDRVNKDSQDSATGKFNHLKFIFRYFLRYKRYFAQLAFGLLGGSLLTLAFPLLTQGVVDIGIQTKDVNFILLLLIIQLALFLGNTFIEFIRSQLLLHISTRINISITYDFLTKLMKLPIRFFDSKNVADITNRISDQKRIETFITTSVLNTLFSFINFIVLTALLSFYNITILLVFLAGSIVTFLWTLLFMKKRRSMDYQLFNSLSANSHNIYEMVNGMQEIKLNNFELHKKQEWQKHQSKLFRMNLLTLRLEQNQVIGSVFFTQLKNILITFIAAGLVIKGEISFGVMLSVSLIIGQLNSPIDQFITFIKSYQWAKISVERMQEVFSEKDEEQPGDISFETNAAQPQNPVSNIFIPADKDVPLDFLNATGEGIILRNVTFQYDGPRSPKILDNLNLYIPKGKTTAIVGVSGSGKTSLLKLLLRFYAPVEGQILVNGNNLQMISPAWWRQQCGIVMQDGYIFSDSIARNIVTGDENVDEKKMKHVAELACISEFINTLPLGYETKIGSTGVGLSNGQRQRILIARALYKNPDYFFFDEATSSLDANNERAIVENLANVFAGKTVVIVAHRLSTVRNADQIVVLDNGSIIEFGTHEELARKKGHYYRLVKNQLELGT